MSKPTLWCLALVLLCVGLAPTETADAISIAEHLTLSESATACTVDGDCSGGFCVDGTCCAVACPARPNTVVSCPAGTACSYACTAGWADCDADLGNGCEVDITTSSNCGGCGAAAQGGPNNAFICSTTHLLGSTCLAGACFGSCETGWGDCNSDKSVAGGGCESSLNLPQKRTAGGAAGTAAYPITVGVASYTEGITNCGACGNVCSDGNDCTTDLCVPGATVGSCQHFNRNTCATARCAGGGYLAVTGDGATNQAACQGADSDVDGIPDGWETTSTNPYTGAANPRGIDIDCDGVIASTNDFQYPVGELPSLATKDVYLKISSMGQRPGSAISPCGSDADCSGNANEPYCDLSTGSCSDEPSAGHQPEAASIALVKNAFLSHRITLHVDSTTVIPHADALKFFPDDVCSLGPAEDYFASAKVPPYWDTKLQYVYHYAVFAHDWCVVTASGNASGNAEILGGDIAVTLGTTVFPLTGTPSRSLIEGGALMHQLGHNLGLPHLLPLRGPNHLSVMNYRYQFTGISPADLPITDPPTASGTTPRLGFSSFDMADLDEGDLNENTILQSGSNDTVTFNCPGGNLRRGSAGRAIDWNCNGETGGAAASETNTAVNIDGVTPITFDNHPGRNDQSLLAFGFQCQPTFSNGASLPPSSTTSGELTVQDAIFHHDLLPLLDVKIDVRSSCTSNWIFLGSKGVIPITLYGSATFDVGDVVVSSLDFSGAGATATESTDENADGYLDLRVLVKQSQMNLTSSSRVGTLTGFRTNSQAFQGSDAVNVANGQPRRGGVCPAP